MNTTDTIKNLAKKLDKELAKFEYQQDEIYATIQITKAEMLALEKVVELEKVVDLFEIYPEGSILEIKVKEMEDDK